MKFKCFVLLVTVLMLEPHTPLAGSVRRAKNVQGVSETAVDRFIRLLSGYLSKHDQKDQTQVSDNVRNTPATMQWPSLIGDCNSNNALHGGHGSYSSHQNHWDCGRSTFHGLRLNPSPLSRLMERIVGGSFSSPGQWPWFAAVGVRGTGGPICGGSLIDPQWVLTAAHCVDQKSMMYVNNFSPSPNLKACQWTVRLGTPNNILQPDQGSVDITASKVFYHRDYTSNPISKDIALIKLEQPAHLTDRIAPLCLPEKGFQPRDGDQAYVIGYGQNNVQSQQDMMMGLGQVDYNLRHLRLNVRNCPSYWPKQEQMVCATSDAYGQSPCSGDSGGPLVVKRNNKWHQIGVMAAVQDCGSDPHTHNFFMSTNYFYDWVIGIMKNN